MTGVQTCALPISVVRVLEFLQGRRAIGAITTHDLELAEHGSLAKILHCVHFQETIHGPESSQPITFDYSVRPGVATTTNALRLLELVGLTADAASGAESLTGSQRSSP